MSLSGDNFAVLYGEWCQNNSGRFYMSNDKKSFESSLEELEKLVSSLEDGELSLEESLEKFEEGTKLYTFCKDQLGSAEKKITRLSESLKEVNLEE